jgi:hypothetical protein
MRYLQGRQCEWEYKLCKIHGSNWKALCGDREIWKGLETAFICERFWELGREPPCDHTKPTLDANYRANFHATLDAPKKRGTLEKVNVIVAISSEEVVNACLGRIRHTGCKYLYCRLQQALYLVTGFSRAICTGATSIFLTIPGEDNFARTMARGAALLEEDNCTGAPARLRHGDTLVGYVGGAKTSLGSGMCSALYLWREGQGEPLALEICTRRVPVQEVRESEALATLCVLQSILRVAGGVDG